MSPYVQYYFWSILCHPILLADPLCCVSSRFMLTILSCSRCHSLDSKPSATSGHFLVCHTASPCMNTHVCVCESLHATDSRIFDLCKKPGWWQVCGDNLFRGTELRTIVLCLDSILACISTSTMIPAAAPSMLFHPHFVCHIHSAKSCSPASCKKYVKDGNFSLQIVVLIIAKITFLWCSVSLGLSAVNYYCRRSRKHSVLLSTISMSESETFPTQVNSQNIVMYEQRAKHVEAFELHIL